MADALHAVAGMLGLLSLAWLAGENRRAIPWRAVGAGLALLLLLAVLFLKVEPLKKAFLALNDALLVLEKATQAGTSFVFGYLGGGAVPFDVSNEGSNFVLAFRALPLAAPRRGRCAWDALHCGRDTRHLPHRGHGGARSVEKRCETCSCFCSAATTTGS